MTAQPIGLLGRIRLWDIVRLSQKEHGDFLVRPVAALTNVKEALELHFEPPTRPPAVHTVEVEAGAA